MALARLMEETTRLDHLRNLALDTIAEPEVFSKITDLAADMFECEIALISIVDKEHQWFLGRTGLALEQLPREATFCSVAIMNEHPLLVSDALQDFRFSSSPLVVGQPRIRSYLGVPIRSQSGALIGALSVIARQPGAFTDADIPRLKALAELTETCVLAHVQTLELSTANASLSQFNRLFRQAEKAANIGAWRIDIASEKLTWSDQVYEIHGIDSDVEIDVTNAMGFYDEQGQKVVSEAMFKALDSSQPFNFEANIRRADGKTRRVRAVGERIDVDGKSDCIAGIFLDCTEEHLRTAALKRAAERDRLTGLYNRAVFDRKLTEALNRGTGEKVTMMLLDLDGFKEVNDRFGHLMGDEVLANIATSLRRMAGETIFLARWGGDEFAFLFPAGTTQDDAADFANDLVSNLTEKVVSGKDVMVVGGTCGIAQLPLGGNNAELVRRADLALYHGKAQDRNSVTCWSETIEGEQSARKDAIAALQSALQHDRAFPVYQPIVDLETGSMVAVEALLRLTDENDRLISASEIFPALLDPVLSRRVSLMMLDKAYKEGEQVLQRFGPECRIGINVSEADLRKGGFADQVAICARHSSLGPRNLTIEVTETMLLTDHAGHIRKNLERLDELGCTIALDDFGTGFSSLTHLRNFPIRKIKIDKEFISTIESDHQSRLIIQALVQMGQSLDMRIVAEGVETQAQVDYLKSIGCSHAQGYFFGKPMSVRELVQTASEPEAEEAKDAA